MKLSDIITTQHNKFVIASGQHRKPTGGQQCDNCKYELAYPFDLPCSECNWDGNRLTQYEPKQVKPSREDTERIIMDSMKRIRDAYKGYCDCDIQRLYLCFTGGKISFFNNFWKEDSGTPINKYEEES